jgi:hypothetical protein
VITPTSYIGISLPVWGLTCNCSSSSVQWMTLLLAIAACLRPSLSAARSPGAVTVCMRVTVVVLCVSVSVTTLPECTCKSQVRCYKDSLWRLNCTDCVDLAENASFKSLALFRLRVTRKAAFSSFNFDICTIEAIRLQFSREILLHCS